MEEFHVILVVLVITHVALAIIVIAHGHDHVHPIDPTTNPILDLTAPLLFETSTYLLSYL